MICDVCGCEYEIGQWPYCPHPWVNKRRPFVPWIDEHISDTPVEIRSLAQWNRLLRENQCDLRDQPTKGDMAARADRCNEMQKEAMRG
jgi:hypothetical protein